MKSFTICALLAAGAHAVPFVAQQHAARHHQHHKRAVVWVTETDIDTVTVPVTKTVWVDGNPQTTQEAAYQSSASTTQQAVATSLSTAYVQPLPASSSSSTSEYVAPASYAQSTSSSSEYVAPTTAYVAPTSSADSTTTSSSTYVAPVTTSAYSAPAYTPASSSVTTTSSAAAAPSGYGSASYTGDLTYYDVGLGSCGMTNTDSDMVVALAADMMTGNKATYCGAVIEVNYGGASHTATIVDTCPGCTAGGLDMAPSLFTNFAPTATGRVHSAVWSIIATPTASAS